MITKRDSDAGVKKRWADFNRCVKSSLNQTSSMSPAHNIIANYTTKGWCHLQMQTTFTDMTRDKPANIKSTTMTLVWFDSRLNWCGVHE